MDEGGDDDEEGGGRKASRAARAQQRATTKATKVSGGEPGPPVDGAALRIDEWILDVDEQGLPLRKPVGNVHATCAVARQLQHDVWLCTGCVFHGTFIHYLHLMVHLSSQGSMVEAKHTCG